MLRAEYPAVAALDSGAVKDLPNTGENNQQLQEEMQQRFTQIQAQIDELSEKLQESPHLALHLDVMVSETLAQQEISEEGREAGDHKSEAVLNWIEGQKRKDALIKRAGTAATVILGLLALISGPLGWSGMAAAGLGLGAGAAGTATALYEQPQLDVQDLGAQAGEAGGQPLTSMDPEEARFARILGRVNVVLGILDMGLEVGALSRLIRQPRAMEALSELTPEQMSQVDQVVRLKQSGQVEEAETVLGHLRGEVGDEVVDQIASGVAELASPGGLGSLEGARTPGLGETATMEELLRISGVPGRQGVILTQKRVILADIWKLSQQTGLEYVLTRENGKLILRSGAPDRVRFPYGVRPIAHTHLPDQFGLPEKIPSLDDIDTLNTLWRINPNGPRPTSVVIWGPEPGNATPFRASGLDELITKGGE